MSSIRTVGILGGGISGLSTAYYLRKKFGDHVKTILLEKSPRAGGWIRTVSRTDGNDIVHYELGPRTIRPAGLSGMNTLDLIEELGLGGQVHYADSTNTAAMTRLIFHKNKLVQLPNTLAVLFAKTEPFDKPLIFAGLRDLFKFRYRTEDDSLYNFVHRRFGKDVADYAIDPVVRGICGGDAKQISVKFLMKSIFEYEQKYGSALLGVALSRFQKGQQEAKIDVGFSNIALAAVREKWTVWTLEGGLQLLPYALEKVISKDENVTIKKNVLVKAIKLMDDHHRSQPAVALEYSSPEENENSTIICDHLISAIPSWELGSLLRRSKPSYPNLWKVFETMSGIDMQVTTLMYKSQDLIEKPAFGFLVPSSEKSVEGLLGIVFDTSVFPQGERTILTVMSRPGVEGSDLASILNFVEKTLGISVMPDDSNIEILRNCIPQYTVGHYEKVDAVRRYIKAAKLPLSLVGASFDGISVNDAIYSGKKAVDDYFEWEDVDY